MEISSTGRAIAEQVMSSADNFASGIDDAIRAEGSGGWSPGPLWNRAILSMRTQAGGLAQNLEFLKLMGDDVLQHLPAELRNQLDQQLASAKKILDEIHTDRGGDFASSLTGFKQYGLDVSTQIKEILRKADEAGASSATQAVNGAEVVDWTITTAKPGVETVKETVKAAEQVQTMAAGGR